MKDHQALILAKQTASAIRLRAKDIRDELIRAQQSMTLKSNIDPYSNRESYFQTKPANHFDTNRVQLNIQSHTSIGPSVTQRDRQSRSMVLESQNAGPNYPAAYNG